MGKLGSLNFLKDEIPKDAEIMLKNGNDEIILTGEEYNRLRDNIRKSGKRGNLSPSQYSDYDTSREDFERGRARVGERAAVELIQSLQEEDDDDGDDDKSGGTKGLTDKQMNLLLKSYAGVTDYSFDGGNEGYTPPSTTRPTPKPEQRTIQDEDPAEASGGPGIPTTAQEVNQIIADFDARNQQQDDEQPSGGTQYSIDDGYSDYAASDDFSEDVDYYDYGFQQGGLVGKKKPKAKKKMKQGGLASKK